MEPEMWDESLDSLCTCAIANLPLSHKAWGERFTFDLTWIPCFVRPFAKSFCLFGMGEGY